MSYYNTTHLTGATLLRCKHQAGYQDSEIIELFKKRKRLSPTQAWRILSYNDWPITSIRRSFTTLTKKGNLRKTEDRVQGEYGRLEYVWEIV